MLQNCVTVCSIDLIENGPVCTTFVQDALCGEDNGVIEALGAGGAPPFSYSWSNGFMGQTQNNLSPGTYTITVTDANGCTSECVATIFGTGGLVVDITPGNASCNEANGSAAAFVNNNTGIFSYEWSNGASTSFVTGLAPGSYSVIVTDSIGCTATAVTEILDNGFPISNAVINNPFCDQPSGNIMVSNATGGCGGYSFQWEDGSTSDVLANLGAGVYGLTITDDCGCTSEEVFTLDAIEVRDLAGKVWIDQVNSANPNLYDVGEPLATNVIVRLYEEADLTNPIQSTTTDVSGYYSFENLTFNYYEIEVVLPQGFQFVTPNIGQDDTIDSDINLATGRVGVEFEEECDIYDAGIRIQ